MSITIDVANQRRWQAIKHLAYNPDFGIERYWLAHPEIGPPLSGEDDLILADGRTVRARVFLNAVVLWLGDHAEEWAP